MADYMSYLMSNATTHGYTSEDQLYQMAGQVFPSGSKAAKLIADGRIQNYAFKDTVKHVLSEYRPRSQEVVSRLTQNDYRQTQHESVSAYLDKVVALLNTYNVRELDIDTSMLNIIVGNLFHEQLRMHIAVKQRETIMSWPDVRAFAIDMDATLSVARRGRSDAVSRTPYARLNSNPRDSARPRSASQDTGPKGPPASTAEKRTVRFPRDPVRARVATPHPSQSPGRHRGPEAQDRQSASRSQSGDPASRTVACVTVHDDEDVYYC
jgi:hypothetical protein